MSEQNKALVRRWTEEIWNQGMMSAIDEIVAADYVHHDPMTPDIRGRETLKQHVAALHAAIPDINYTTEDLIAEGDKVVQRCTFVGTHRADWMGIPPTGKRMEGTATVTLRIAQAKVAEIWVNWDALGSMQRLGAITDPAVLAANKAVVRRYAENLHSSSNSVAFELVAGDVVMHSPHTPPINNRAEFEEYITRSDAAFSGLRFTTRDLIAEGDRVALRFNIAGTLTSEWKGINPNGRAFEISGVGTYRLRAGKIAEISIDWDALGAMQQLGAVPTPTEANKALVRRYFEELLNKGNLALTEDLFAADSAFRPQHVPEMRGLEARMLFFTKLLIAFPDIRFTIEEVTAEGDRVVVRWTQSATHRGEWMGVPPAGKRVTWSGITELRISGGKIVDESAAWDALSAVQQLGAIPALA